MRGLRIKVLQAGQRQGYIPRSIAGHMEGYLTEKNTREEVKRASELAHIEYLEAKANRKAGEAEILRA